MNNNVFSRDEVISVYKKTQSTDEVLKYFNYSLTYVRKKTEIIKILKEEGIFVNYHFRGFPSKEQIISAYKETYSVSQVLLYFGYTVTSSSKRNKITKMLKEEGVYDGAYGKNAVRKKIERIEKTNLEIYGVKNYSYTKHGSLNLHNHRDKTSFPIVEEFRLYQQQVTYETKKTIRKLKHIPKPTHCEYLGVEFVDDNIANPNDQLKRTIDHKKSVYNCWLDGLSPEEASHQDNLVWICRYANSIKGNADYDDIKYVFPKIKEKLCHLMNCHTTP